MRGENLLRYREDIDGLRALAVLPVILYHLGFSGVPGGYIGVDVFFVISGYLISLILFDSISTGKSLSDFWFRRARRILPALLFMVFVVFIVYFFLFSPAQLKLVSGVTLSQLFFLSNAYLLRLTSDYFGAEAEENPLLHTWSLSVEEQFYLLFPLILLCVKNSKFKLYVLSFLALISLSVNLLWTNYLTSVPFDTGGIWKEATFKDAAFFLVFSRAWELLAGSLLAYFVYYKSWRIQGRFLSETLSLLGVGFIIYSIAFYTRESNFPGFLAIIPVLGTLMFIASNDSRLTFLGQLISCKPFVWVGLISYSLYLWHWPVYVVLSDLHVIEDSLGFKASALLLSLFLAYLSYHYVEKPFRKGRAFKDKKSLVFTLGGGLCALVVICTFFYVKGGMPSRFEVYDISAADLFNARRHECHSVKNVDVLEQDGPCFFGSKEKKVDLVAIGDSHLDSIYPGLEQTFISQELAGVYASYSSCIPVVGLQVKGDRLRNCYQAREWLLDYAVSNHVDSILLVARWSVYVHGMPNGDLKHVAVDSGEFNSRNALMSLERRLLALGQKLAEHDVDLVVMLEVPDQLMSVPNKVFSYRVRPDFLSSSMVGINLEEYEKRVSGVRKIFLSLQSKLKNFRLLDPKEYLCDELNCHFMDGKGFPLYRDSHHLTPLGSMKLIPLFKKINQP